MWKQYENIISYYNIENVRYNIHNDLINMGESVCPYCDQILITESNNEAIPCCEDQYIVNNGNVNICLKCGSVHSYNNEPEFIDFYENVYKIRRKSVYIRKYHIENIMNDLLINQRVELTHNQRDRIYKEFEEIGAILHEVNGNRKRMISTKYIMKKILEMMGLPYNIPITKSKRTLSFYRQYWTKIMALIGDKIETIIVK